MNKIEIDFTKFPTTRYQGSKRKILPWIYEHIKDLKFHTAIDVFGGTGSVSYLLKKLKKQVTFNDDLRFNYLMGKALIENNVYTLSDNDINNLISRTSFKSDFVERTFKNIYYLDHENVWIDTVISNILNMNHYEPTMLEYKKALAYYALFQSCLIKRPFNLFHRKNLYLRTNEVLRKFGNKTTWEKTFDQYLHKFSNHINDLVIDTGQECKSINCCAFTLDSYGFELAYIDPPYFRRDGSNESSDYFKCYHFLEGLSNFNDWSTLINYDTINLRIKENGRKYQVMEARPIEAFEELIENFKKCKIVFSYKQGGKPSIDTIVRIMKKFKKNVYTVSMHYKYALNHQNGNAKYNREVLIIGV